MQLLYKNEVFYPTAVLACLPDLLCNLVIQSTQLACGSNVRVISSVAAPFSTERALCCFCSLRLVI